MKGGYGYRGKLHLVVHHLSYPFNLLLQILTVLSFIILKI